MAIVRRTDIDDDVREIELTGGEVLELHADDDSVRVLCNGNEVGRISFQLYESPISPDQDETIARLTHAFIEGDGGRYKRHGIGTEAVRFFCTTTGYTLELPDNDGQRKDDGSHLVNDGPAFVAGLRRKMDAGEFP